MKATESTASLESIGNGLQTDGVRPPSAAFGRFKDEAEWRAWQRDRARTQQRARRARLRRIDYYASQEAAKVIDRLRRPYAGGDASSIINRALLEWAANANDVPELNSGKESNGAPIS